MNHQHAKPRLRGKSSRNFKYGRPARVVITIKNIANPHVLHQSLSLLRNAKKNQNRSIGFRKVWLFHAYKDPGRCNGSHKLIYFQEVN